MVKRKPVLLVDNSDDSTKAVDLLKRLGIEYVEYDINLMKAVAVSYLQLRLLHFLQLKVSLKAWRKLMNTSC